MPKDGREDREEHEAQQFQARLLVIERGEQELREMVRDLTRNISKLDETNQQKIDQLSSEFRSGLRDIQNEMVKAREADRVQADEHGFRVWGPALTVAGLILSCLALVIGGATFYLNQRFDFAESDIRELETQAAHDTKSLASLAHLRDDLQSMQVQLNLARDFGYRLQVRAEGHPDPGPRYFPGTHTAIGTASPTDAASTAP
jgi:hypothetical protein